MDTEKNKKAIIIDSQPQIFQESQLRTPYEIILKPDDEFELVEAEDNAIRILLPDGTKGYIREDVELNILSTSWITKEAAMYEDTDVKSAVLHKFKKGEKLELLNIVPGTKEKWIRVRLLNGTKGFLPADTKVITEDSLLERIGELIGAGSSEHKIIKQFKKQGIPENEIQEGYVEVQKAIKEYRESPEGKKEISKQYSKKILYSAFWIVGGLLATYISMQAASDGGTYFLFWGAVVFGVIDLIRGIAGYAKYS